MITLKMITRLHRFVPCYYRPQTKLREGNAFTGTCLLTGVAMIGSRFFQTGWYPLYQVPSAEGIPGGQEWVHQGWGEYTRGWGVAGIPGVGIPGHGLVYQGQVYQEWGWIYLGVGITGAGGGYDLVYPLIPTPSQWY